MARTAPRRARLALLLAISAAAGCAVTTIDVDVYKGPLANHEDVQVHQMAVMAIGAKPLLVQLRDRLEVYHGRYDQEAQWAREEATKPENAKPHVRWVEELKRRAGYNANGPVPEGFLQCPDAERVNEILSLYENRLSDRTTEYRRRVKTLLHQYRTQLEKVRPSPVGTAFTSPLPDTPEEDKLVAQLRNAVRTPSGKVFDPVALLGVDVDSPQSKTESRPDSGHSALRAQLVDAALRQIAAPGVPTTESEEDQKQRRVQLQNVHHLRYRVLAETDLAEQIASKVLKLEGREAEQFAERVKESSQAYLNAREILTAIWLTSVEYIRWLGEQPNIVTNEAKEHLSEVATFAIQILQPRYLAAVLAVQKAQNVENIKLDSLNLPPYGDWTTADYDAAERRLHEAFRSNPVETAKTLLASHEYATKTIRQSSAAMNNLQGRLRYPAGWQFGIVRPSLEDNEGKRRTSTTVEEAYAQITFRGIFSGGRLDTGLTERIEIYLTAIEQRSGAARDTAGDNARNAANVARLRLRDELVAFAEKLLVIANNDVLIEKRQRPGMFLQFGGGLMRATLGDRLTDACNHCVSPDNPGLLDSSREHVRVLQAIGNSILIQADELTHREKHDERLRDPGKKRELNAARLSAQIDTPTRLAEWTRALQESAARAAKEAEEAKKVKDAAQKKFDEAQTSRDTARTEVEAAEQTAREPIKARDQAKTELSKTQTRFKLFEESAPVGKELRAAVKDDATPSAGDYFETVRKVLRDKFNLASNARSSEAAVLNEAIQFLTGDRQQIIQKLNEPQAPTQGSVLHTRFKSYRDEQLKRAEAKLEDTEKEALAQESNLKSARNKLEELEAALKTATEARDTAARRNEEASSASANAAEAAKLVPTIVSEMLASSSGVPPSASAAYGQIVGNLQQKIAAATAEADKTKLRQALAGFQHGITPPAAETAAAPADDGHTTAKDVLDELIARLRYEHLEAVRTHGESHETSQRFAAALKLAYEQRSGMIYIRPPAAYLRSSFAATSLQDDPRLRWDNMLGQHAMRSIPFGPQLRDIFDPIGRRDAEVVADIDKQFWQNINRVRVAGGGLTNYAMIKDDIGNWHVKSFSADPKPIVESAKNLALFGMGATLPIKTPDGQEAPPPAPSSGLTRVLSAHEKAYKDATTTQAKDLNAALAAVKESITRAWNADTVVTKHVATFTPAIDAAHTAHLKKLQEQTITAATAEDIYVRLEALKRFSDDLAGQIHDVAAPDDAKAAKEAAVRHAARTVRQLLEQHIQRRRETLKNLEDAAMVLGHTEAKP